MQPLIESEFGAMRGIYLDVAARGLLPRTARRAVERMLDTTESVGADKPRFLALVERVRGRVATLLGVTLEEIAFTKNVSEGLNLVGASLPWRHGDNVVFCPEIEHPNNVYPWLNLERTHGVRPRAVRWHGSTQTLLEAIDERTRLVAVSVVSFASGHRIALDEIGRRCREVGAFLLADGAQSVGVLRSDVDTRQVDGLATASQKGLLGLYGLGVLYVRRDRADELRPPFLARFGVALDDAHEAALDRHDYRLRHGAGRFEYGNYNYVGLAALDRSLALLHQLGPVAVESRALRLADQLRAGLRDRGLPVVGPGESHIVAVGTRRSARHDEASDPTLRSLHRYLLGRQVRHSVRSGLLRFSTHVYNTPEHIDEVLDLVDAWRQ